MGGEEGGSFNAKYQKNFMLICGRNVESKIHSVGGGKEGSDLALTIAMTAQSPFDGRRNKLSSIKFEVE